MHRAPPHRAPFTTTAIRSGAYPPAEYARMADEALSLLGHPDGQVRLEPTLPDGDSVRLQTTCPAGVTALFVSSFCLFFSHLGTMSRYAA